jgi:hypothetical protein
MGHGTKKSSITSVFRKRVIELQERARLWSLAFKNGDGYFKWSVPDEAKEPLDVPSLHVPAWERNEINQKYSVDVMGDPESPGTVGDIYSLKIQADFLAVEERAYRTRHASLPRASAIAHGRLSGHGAGSVFSEILISAQEAAAKGAEHSGK